MNKDVPSIQAAIDEIEDALADLLECGDRCRRPVGRIFRRLKDLRRLAVAATDGGPPHSATASGPAPQTRKQPKEYVVRTVRGRAMLAEIRAGGRNPFYCPKDVVEAVAKALSATDHSMSYDDIVKRVSHELGRQPPDFHIRVVLRFLTDPTIGLAKHDRARYAPAGRGTIHRSAVAAWNVLAKAKHDR